MTTAQCKYIYKYRYVSLGNEKGTAN